jgi:CBS domain-containing protein
MLGRLDAAMPRTPVRKFVEGKKVLKTSRDTSVAKAAKLMGIKRVGAIAIVEEEHLLGILTERDVLTRVVALGLDPEATPVTQVMTPDPQTVTPDAPIEQVLALMRNNGYRHMPVVENDHVIGMVSIRARDGAKVSS